MEPRSFHFAWSAALMLAGCIAFSGCGKDNKGTPQASAQQSDQKSKVEVTAESLGLGPGAQNMGDDPLGRYWFRIPLHAADGHEIPGQYEQKVYDPKSKTLFKATKGSDGKLTLTPQPEFTAESLGLGADAEDMGKDPMGRYWFRIKGSAERRVYVPSGKKLYRATKKTDGQWNMQEIALPKA